jgi:hypothetical protein
MDELKIPKFENEADEANWAYEHREELATLFMNQFGKGGVARRAANKRDCDCVGRVEWAEPGCGSAGPQSGRERHQR